MQQMSNYFIYIFNKMQITYCLSLSIQVLNVQILNGFCCCKIKNSQLVEVYFSSFKEKKKICKCEKKCL